MPLSSFIKLLNSEETHPVINPTFTSRDYTALDLSINNIELKNVDVSSSKVLEKFIWSHLKENNAKVAFGGYLEKRKIYQRSTYFNKESIENERNIHLGIDLWIEANSAIYAPLHGEIHSYKNNTNFGDYGPTIVLKHQIKSQTFYTLYGHLCLASLQNKQVGTKIKKGEEIATLGTAEVNGDYPPHLHFQIIKDMENYKGDYPGVCNINELDYYKSNCPDPNLILKL